MKIDLYDNHYEDTYDKGFPVIVSWINPENSEERTRLIRSEKESNEFFSWFRNKYPSISYTVT